MKNCIPQQYQWKSISCVFPIVVEKRFRPKDFALKIINIVCVEYKISELQIVSRNRERSITDARHVAMFFIFKYCQTESKTSIGYMFDRDHSTVIAAIAKVNDLFDTDKEFAKIYEAIESRIEFHKNQLLD